MSMEKKTGLILLVAGTGLYVVYRLGSQYLQSPAVQSPAPNSVNVFNPSSTIPLSFQPSQSSTYTPSSSSTNIYNPNSSTQSGATLQTQGRGNGSTTSGGNTAPSESFQMGNGQSYQSGTIYNTFSAQGIAARENLSPGQYTVNANGTLTIK